MLLLFPTEENVRQTRAVVELAASAQLCVEGELGHLADAPRYDQSRQCRPDDTTH